jgi:hypothetical protein
MSTPFRNHPVSLTIRLKIRLLQMDLMKSERVMITIMCADGTKDCAYLPVEEAFRCLETHKFHYDNYYKGKRAPYKIAKIHVEGYANKNRLSALRKL